MQQLLLFTTVVSMLQSESEKSLNIKQIQINIFNKLLRIRHRPKLKVILNEVNNGLYKSVTRKITYAESKKLFQQVMKILKWTKVLVIKYNENDNDVNHE